MQTKSKMSKQSSTGKWKTSIIVHWDNIYAKIYKNNNIQTLKVCTDFNREAAESQKYQLQDGGLSRESVSGLTLSAALYCYTQESIRSRIN